MSETEALVGKTNGDEKDVAYGVNCEITNNNVHQKTGESRRRPKSPSRTNSATSSSSSTTTTTTTRKDPPPSTATKRSSLERSSSHRSRSSANSSRKGPEPSRQRRSTTNSKREPSESQNTLSSSSSSSSFRKEDNDNHHHRRRRPQQQQHTSSTTRRPPPQPSEHVVKARRKDPPPSSSSSSRRSSSSSDNHRRHRPSSSSSSNTKNPSTSLSASSRPSRKKPTPPPPNRQSSESSGLDKSQTSVTRKSSRASSSSSSASTSQQQQRRSKSNNSNDNRKDPPPPPAGNHTTTTNDDDDDNVVDSRKPDYIIPLSPSSSSSSASNDNNNNNKTTSFKTTMARRQRRNSRSVSPITNPQMLDAADWPMAQEPPLSSSSSSSNPHSRIQRKLRESVNSLASVAAAPILSEDQVIPIRPGTVTAVPSSSNSNNIPRKKTTTTTTTRRSSSTERNVAATVVVKEPLEEPSAALQEPEPFVVVVPGTVTAVSNRRDSRVQRKIRASLSPVRVARPQEEEQEQQAEPVVVEPPLPGTVTAVRNNNTGGRESRIQRKIRSSLSPVRSSVTTTTTTAVSMEEPSPVVEPAAIVPGTVTAVRNNTGRESRIQRKIRSSLSPVRSSITTNAAAAASMEEPSVVSEPAAIVPGTVTAVRGGAPGESRVQRKIRASLSPVRSSVTTDAAAAAAAIEEPSLVSEPAAIVPGTVTAVRGGAPGESRVQRKIRASLSPSRRPLVTHETNGPNDRVARKMSAASDAGARRSVSVVSPDVLADVAQELGQSDPDEHSQEMEPLVPQPGTVSVVRNNSRVADKIARASMGVGATPSTNDSAVRRKTRFGSMSSAANRAANDDGGGGDEEAPRVGAVQTVGDDPAARKGSWINDELFRRDDDDGRHYDPDDYLRQQVRANEESKKEKNKKKEDDLNEKGISMKNGAAVVPKLPGAYAVKTARGWFTGGFRARSRMGLGRSMRRSINGVTTDTNIETAKPDELPDENEMCCCGVDRPTLCVGACLLVFMILAISIPVGLVTNPDPIPTLAPSHSREPVYDEFRNFFWNISGEALEDPSSPQSQALDFVVFGDDLELNTSNPSALQRYVLMTTFYANGGDGWTFKTEPWGSGVSECQWDFVRCTAESTIRQLDLLNTGLTGTLVPELLHLSNLRGLDIAGNQFSYDEFPPFLFQLTNLVFLYVDTNEWRGTISSEIGNLTNLEHLFLGNNFFTGSLPSELGTLSNLTALNVPQNRFVGNPFNVMLQLPNLERVDLGNNKFTGGLPTELGLLTNLSELLLQQNKFTGTLHSELGLLSLMRSFSTSRVPLSPGTIPSEIFAWSNLEILLMESSGLTGTFPTEFGIFESAKRIVLQSNQLSGTIPTQLARCTALEELAINSNDLSMTVPTELGQLSSLNKLLLQRNDFSGMIPNEICLLGLETLSADCLGVTALVECSCCTGCT